MRYSVNVPNFGEFQTRAWLPTYLVPAAVSPYIFGLGDSGNAE